MGRREGPLASMVTSEVPSNKISAAFWSGKRVFVTGSTGFKGSWLTLWLAMMGCSVKGYALPPATKRSLFADGQIDEFVQTTFSDIRDLPSLTHSMKAFDPEIVFHLAAQPLVGESYMSPVDTYTTNVIGTVHVLEATRACENVRALINVTTDKCYENKEWPWGYRETDRLGGSDPYSSSKACSELVTSAYRSSFFSTREAPSIATARAGNVIGGGDWTPGRLIPDIFEAHGSGQTLTIRNPRAVRPWQHVLDPLYGYILLAESLCTHGKRFSQEWNFGPTTGHDATVESILQYVNRSVGNSVLWRPSIEQEFHETSLLQVDSSKARRFLGWRPQLPLNRALDLTIEWHLAVAAGENVQKVTRAQINDMQQAVSLDI
jgi:CDP-glucose 4,6-dehydratase